MRNSSMIPLLTLAVALPGCAEGDSFKELFSDTFNRASGGMGSDWNSVVDVGSFEIRDQAALPTGGTSTAVYVNSVVPTTEMRIIAEVFIHGGAIDAPTAQVVARGEDTSLSGSEYLCGFDGANTLSLKKSASTLASGTKTAALSDGDRFTLYFTQNGSILTCSATGDFSDSVDAVDLNELSGGFHGIRGGKSGSDFLFFDSFAIEEKEL